MPGRRQPAVAPVCSANRRLSAVIQAWRYRDGVDEPEAVALDDAAGRSTRSGWSGSTATIRTTAEIDRLADAFGLHEFVLEDLAARRAAHEARPLRRPLPRRRVRLRRSPTTSSPTARDRRRVRRGLAPLGPPARPEDGGPRCVPDRRRASAASSSQRSEHQRARRGLPPVGAPRRRRRPLLRDHRRRRRPHRRRRGGRPRRRRSTASDGARPRSSCSRSSKALVRFRRAAHPAARGRRGDPAQGGAVHRRSRDRALPGSLRPRAARRRPRRDAARHAHRPARRRARRRRPTR